MYVCTYVCIVLYVTITLQLYAQVNKSFFLCTYVCMMDRTGPRKSNDFGDDDSIANSTVVGNYNSGNGSGSKGVRDQLTEEMFLQDNESELLVSDDAEKIRTLALSTKAPAILLGWKVLYVYCMYSIFILYAYHTTSNCCSV